MRSPGANANFEPGALFPKEYARALMLSVALLVKTISFTSAFKKPAKISRAPS